MTVHFLPVLNLCCDFIRVQDHNLEQLASLKAGHQKEMEHLVARHAREHSSSQVAELTNQLKTKEVYYLFFIINLLNVIYWGEIMWCITFTVI